MRIFAIYFFTVLLAMENPVFSQSFSYDETREDLLQLIQEIKTYNPALTNYNPLFDVQTAHLLDEQLRQQKFTHFEYFQLVNKICAMSNEGHFSMGNWQDVFHAGILENTFSYLPISIVIEGNHLFIWNDFSNEQTLARGDEILSINNRTASEILKLMRSMTPSDGQIESYQNRTLELGFTWMYYLFIDQSETHSMVIQREVSDGMSDSIKTTITAIPRDSQQKNYNKYIQSDASPTQEEGFYTLQQYENYAYLKLPSFDYSRVQKFDVTAKKMYGEIFKQLQEKKAPNLIIDLRNNTGGRNEFADDMVPFLISKKPTDPFLKKTISWEGKVRKYKMPKPSKYHFTGKLYVLVNGRTYSAGSTLARYLKEYGNATIIGEESGTRYEGFAAGSSQMITLKNSKISIGIPRYHILFPEASIQVTQNRGVLPDIKVPRSLEFARTSEDETLQTAIDLIK